jgi:hypothetical protein
LLSGPARLSFTVGRMKARRILPADLALFIKRAGTSNLSLLSSWARKASASAVSIPVKQIQSTSDQPAQRGRFCDIFKTMNSNRRCKLSFLTSSLGLALCLLAPAANLEATDEATMRPDLTGTVRGPENQPLTNASVFIYTAGPREGVGYICPSCYADCRKCAQSDAGGRFKIESLDPALLFRILVTAPGCAPKFVGKVDPRVGPLEVELQLRDISDIPAKQLVAGRVLDPAKKPVPQAVVSVTSTHIGNTHYGSPPEGTDPVTVTDEKGAFLLSSKKPFDAVDLQVEARGLARASFPEVAPGSKRHELVLNEGASLTGRVLRDGKPVKDVTIGVAGVERSMGEFVGDFVVGTTPEGTFLFVNLPPNREYFLYGLMDSLRGIGALCVRKIRIKGDGTIMDLGSLQIAPGRRLAGQVKLSDNQPLPAHTRLHIGRKEAWDTSLAVELPPDGEFDLRDLPAESLTVGVALSGYRASARNASLDRLNPFGLAGRLDSDKTNLTLLLEPGKRLPSDGEIVPEDERPENLPLCGIEAKRPNENPWCVTGRVTDVETKALLPEFRITPGRRPFPQSAIEWQRSRSAAGANGAFSLELSSKGVAPIVTPQIGLSSLFAQIRIRPSSGAMLVLMVEADGYLPALSKPFSTNLYTCDFELRKGHGPQGVLVQPNGKPADGVSVYYLGPNEHGNLRNDGQFSLHTFNSNPLKTLTDPDGAFDFPPKLPGGVLVAATSSGFARIDAVDLAPEGKLTLQPWARIHGRLVQNGKPLAGEDLDLEWAEPFSFDRPHIYLHGTKTGDDGSFVVEHVPEGNLRLATRQRMGQGPASGWTTHSQYSFTAEPAADLDLGTINKK